MRRHWVVLGAWAALIVALVVLSRAAGGDYVDDFVLPGAASQEASDLLRERFPEHGRRQRRPPRPGAGWTDRPAARAAPATLFTLASQLPDVTSVIPPQQAPGRVSADGTIAYATILIYARARPERPGVERRGLVRLAEEASGDGLLVEVGGPVVSASERGGEDWAEAIGLRRRRGHPAGRLRLVPRDGAAAGHRAGRARLRALCLGLAAAAIVLATITPSFVAMIGLGVGIDYALFIVTRHREGLAAGLSVEEAAAARSTAPAGR